MRNLLDSIQILSSPGLRALIKLIANMRIGHRDLIYKNLKWEADKDTFNFNMRY